ncbi:sigma-70 family RNA polymerase sigma factor [Bacteroidales bacterium OttesenSCG-928-A17]|nr:sigma-70 family RNA polymerase sigma factor [Bacteroidales bacterium OttesenSCG-928-A17]
MNRAVLEKNFIEMIQQYKAVIYKVTSFYVDEQTSIDDLYQDVVLNLWKSYPSFRHDSAESTWMYRIALNTCISYVRKGKNKPVYIELTSDVIESSEENESIHELYALINQLGKLERALIFLYLEDRPYKEIAEIMGITPTNVSTRINRIKEKLKSMSKLL